MVINTSFPITFTNSPLADSVKHKPWKQLVFLFEALALGPGTTGQPLFVITPEECCHHQFRKQSPPYTR
jgi:hypothetical protein